MPKYQIAGTDRDTGLETCLIVNVESRAGARRVATMRGIRDATIKRAKPGADPLEIVRIPAPSNPRNALAAALLVVLVGVFIAVILVGLGTGVIKSADQSRGGRSDPHISQRESGGTAAPDAEMPRSLGRAFRDTCDTLGVSPVEERALSPAADTLRIKKLGLYSAGRSQWDRLTHAEKSDLLTFLVLVEAEYESEYGSAGHDSAVRLVDRNGAFLGALNANGLLALPDEDGNLRFYPGGN